MGLHRDIIEFLCLFMHVIMETFWAFMCRFQYDQLHDTLKCITEKQVLEWVFWYNRNIVHINHSLHHFYNKHGNVKWIMDRFAFLKQHTGDVLSHIVCLAIQRNCEPYEDNWISFHTITGKGTPVIDYIYLNEFSTVVGGNNILHILTSIFMGRHYSEHMCMMVEDAYYEKHGLIDNVIDKYIEECVGEVTIHPDILITRKYNHSYYFDVLRMNSLHIGSQYKDTRVPSEVRLLVIQYIHPEMKNIIDIKIDENAYYDGNEILSYTFIHRYLHFLPIWHTFVFDDKYILKIMDDNIEQFTLKHNQSILLHVDNYEIISQS